MASASAGALSFNNIPGKSSAICAYSISQNARVQELSNRESPREGWEDAGRCSERKRDPAVDDKAALSALLDALEAELLSGNLNPEHEKLYAKYYNISTTPVRGVALTPRQGGIVPR